MTAHPATISPDQLKRRLGGTEELALLDVREEGAYGTGHILQAVNVPYSRLELLVRAYVPRRSCPVILVGQAGDAADVAVLAAQRLQAIGYSDIVLLDGGVDAWRAAGYELFHGVYVPSKAFGEWLEREYHTPAISALQLLDLRTNGADVVILDPRTVTEYAVRHVPGAVSCPGGELLYRFLDLVPTPDTLVVVACGGRTRGIVGAQNLIDAGVPNSVVALADGTHGWQLAGFELEHGLVRQFEAATPAAAAYAQERAAALVRRTGLPTVDFATFQRWRDDPLRTTYAFDVRTPEEYAAGHLPAVRSAPGGQLVQATDRWMATMGARVVLVDDNGVRAASAAYRLRQMGWDAYVLQDTSASEIWASETWISLAVGGNKIDPIQAPLQTAAAADAAADVQPEFESVSAAAPEISPLEASERLAAGALGISLDTSARFLQSRPPGTIWANRSRLETVIAQSGNGRELILFSEQGDTAHLAAIDLQQAAREKGVAVRLAVVQGGLQAWRLAGLRLDDGAAPQLAEEDRVDTLYWAHTRRQGDKKAMRLYLDWEKALLDQVMRDGHRFSLHVQKLTKRTLMTHLEERQLSVARAIAEIREIHRRDGINVATLLQAARIIERLAAQTSLFSFEHFPVAAAAGQTSVRYQLHIEPDQSYGLYLNTQKPGKSSAVHNHGTWVVIVAVEGEEVNRIYHRTDDGSDPARGVVELKRSVTVRPGEPLVLSGDDIHSIHVEGDAPTLHFHLYGRALETLTERLAFNLETGETSRYNQTHWRPSVIAN